MELKALRVNAELAKLGDAPRAYLDKIALAESMQIDGSGQPRIGGGVTLNERFEKIQGARINGHRGKTLRLIPRPKVAA